MTQTNVRRLGSSLALAAALLAGRAAHAQVFTPSFMGPTSSGDVGLYVSDGAGTAIEGIWRQRSRSGYDLGLRGGFIDVGSGAATVGVELRKPLAVQGAPVALALTGSAQGVLGDQSALGFAAGLTVGHTFVPGTFTVSPYLHPRIALSRSLDHSDKLGADALVDLGLDFGLQPNLSVRLGLGLSSASPDWGIGLAWRR
ncbi:MAG: hypothetical protein JWM27_798 [Gemmatimonadetes bacterium]|nr:hypothetical protein [Gemmatimonadota bacterium]